jgi:TonB family protein
MGSPFQTVIPANPAEARSKRLGGAVQIEVSINSDGKVVAEILSSKGNKILLAAAKAAAMKTRFSSTKCDGKATSFKGILTFNFVPILLTDVHVVHSAVSDFGDLRSDMPYFEPVLVLTENYGLAFGYADGQFHGKAPLTKGDFAHFLRESLYVLTYKLLP